MLKYISNYLAMYELGVLQQRLCEEPLSRLEEMSCQ